MVELLDKLNEKQREAVIQTEGPVLILAGAGSGKTRALTFRVAYLIKQKNVAPKNILAVTFTNKAAQEMTERIKKNLGLPMNIPPYSQYLPHIGTFHSICVRILRKEIEKIGYKKNFVIYDDQDQLALMKRVMKELEIQPNQIKPNAILGAISDAKNKLIDETEFEKEAGSYFEELVAKCYRKYQSELKNADALDFDDLIMQTVKIFTQYKETLGYYQELFKYIMVDEYQDTNHAQYMLLKLLASKHQNICVVGDDFQSIYGWRGADVRNILSFEKDYPDAKVILLEQNYRSTQNILDAAHCVISRNINQKAKKLWTENEKGETLISYQAQDEMEEAEYVAQQMEKLKEEGNFKLNNFAVLYRTNAQSRALEEAFMKHSIPYKIIGGLKFYQRKEIKDMLAFLYFIQNPLDKVSFERIMDFSENGIGKKTIEKIFKFAGGNSFDLIEATEKIADEKIGDSVVKIAASKLKGLKDFCGLIRKLKEFAKNNPVSKTIDFVYRESGYHMMLLRAGEEGQIRHENIMELLTVAKKYDSKKWEGMVEFLEEVALVSQVDRDLQSNEAVPLMTLHSAKGLEFDVVFLVGMEEGLFPHSRAILEEREMEEERRLCYVGITRAKRKMFFLHTQQRNIYGSTQISIRSRFLDEIDDELIEPVYYEEDVIFSDEYDEDSDDGRFFPWRKKRSRQTLSDERSLKKGGNEFRDGQQVQHEEFGKGIVVSQDDLLITVAFPNIGIKKLAKSVAKLKKV